MLVLNQKYYGQERLGVKFFIFDNHDKFAKRFFHDLVSSTNPKVDEVSVFLSDCKYFVLLAKQRIVDITHGTSFSSPEARRHAALNATCTHENRNLFYNYVITDLIYRGFVDGYVVLHGTNVLWISEYDMHNILASNIPGYKQTFEHYSEKELLTPKLEQHK